MAPRTQILAEQVRMDVIALHALGQRACHGWLNLAEPVPTRHRRMKTSDHRQLQGQVCGKVRHRESAHTVQDETGHKQNASIIPLVYEMFPK